MILSHAQRKAHPEAECKLPVIPEGGDHVLDGSERRGEKPSILGLEVLNELHFDMKRTLLPSWIESPPRNLGSASHGKLKADHWRTACTVSLVITLVRLWGQQDSPTRERDMLGNFIDMVVAANAATRRLLSRELIDIFDRHMTRYLNQMVALYGGSNVVPNHHLALHLIECLENFGPVHSWWSFPFERINGKLQRINSNKRTGENLSFVFDSSLLIGF